MKKQIKARIQIITAMIAFGTVGVFVKNIPLSSAEIALYRGVIAVVVLFFVMAASGRLSKIKEYKSQLWKLFLSGAAIGANWILLFEAYRYTSIALSTLSYYFAPTLVVIASAVLLKEHLSVKQVFCFLGSTAGLLLTIGVSGGGSSDFTGILLGIGAAVLYATVVMLNKMTGEIDGITKTWLQFVSAVLVITPYVCLTGGIHIQEITKSGLCNLLIVGIVHTGIMYYLYFTSLVNLSGQQAAILSYIDPCVAVAVSLFILGETVGVLKLLGGLTILIFAFINEINLNNRKKEL